MKKLLILCLLVSVGTCSTKCKKGKKVCIALYKGSMFKSAYIVNMRDESIKVINGYIQLGDKYMELENIEYGAYTKKELLDVKIEYEDEKETIEKEIEFYWNLEYSWKEKEKYTPKKTRDVKEFIKIEMN